MILQDWRFYALMSALFASITAITGKLGMHDLSSNQATWIRAVVILIFTSILLLFRGEWKLETTLPAKSLVFLFISGLETCMSWLFYFHALKLGPASKVAPIDKLSILFTILFSYLFLAEMITIKTFIGGALIFAGSVFLVL